MREQQLLRYLTDLEEIISCKEIFLDLLPQCMKNWQDLIEAAQS